MSAPLTPDFRAKLREQLGYIERSAEAFDKGHREEAIRTVQFFVERQGRGRGS